jgi:hypothetical protein
MFTLCPVLPAKKIKNKMCIAMTLTGRFEKEKKRGKKMALTKCIKCGSCTCFSLKIFTTRNSYFKITAYFQEQFPCKLQRILEFPAVPPTQK